MSAKPNFEDSGVHHLRAENAPPLRLAATARDLRIDPADWDILFGAVVDRLRHAVGEDLLKAPEVPAWSAALAASLIQAEVLDCVSALHQLHVALIYERSQRLTP